VTLWDYCYTHCNLIYNYSLFPFPTGMMSPFQRHFGKPPNLDILHPFGCLVVTKFFQQTKGSFDPRGEPGIHLGIDSNAPHGTFKVLLLSTKEIVSRRSVKFHEDVFPSIHDNMDSLLDRILLTRSLNTCNCPDLQTRLVTLDQ